MFRKYYPYEYADSVFAVNYHKLYELGYQGIIFDIDNTLVHHGEDSTPEIDELFRHIHKVGLKTLLLSNNNRERIQRFIRNIDTLFIEEAGKPDPANYRKACLMMGTEIYKTVCIGDQIFTDICGANRCGMPSILVRFLQKDRNERIGKRRQLERMILKMYQKNRSCQHRLGDIIR